LRVHLSSLGKEFKDASRSIATKKTKELKRNTKIIII
jgi:hypothetical protein